MPSALRVPMDHSLELAVESFGQGPPLVFAHGLTGNRHLTREQLAPLADRYTIVVYDQRGHGESTPVTDPGLYDPFQMAGDMARLLDALGLQRAIVGGESMGAATALLFAMGWPERTEKLLLTAPAFGDQPNPEVERILAMGEAIAQLGISSFLEQARERQRTELGWPEEVIDRVAEMQRVHDSTSLATACLTVPTWQPLPDLELLADLPMPVCILAWPDDPLHPLELAQRMARIIPDAQLHMLPSLTEMFRRPAIIGQAYRRYLEEAEGVVNA